MRIHSARDDIYSGYLIQSVSDTHVSRVFHNDPTCRVCRHTTPGLLLTAAPIPRPYPNPESNPKFQKTVQGGPRGTHWYHGTSWYPEDPAQDSEVENNLSSPGNESYHEYGDRADKHWNTDLGTHFSSIHNVSHEFANNGDPGFARVAHVNLHMQNPKYYKNEDEFGRDAARYALSQGKTFLPNNDRARQDFVEGHDMMDSPGTQDNGNERNYYLNSVQNKRNPVSIAGIDKHGPDAKFGADSPYPGTPRFGGDEVENWLGHHPDRNEITEGFRKHLIGKGHDGVVYGNSYEGPKDHPSAIAFPETPVGIHHWEYIHPEAHEKEKKMNPAPKPVDPSQHTLF